MVICWPGGLCLASGEAFHVSESIITICNGSGSILEDPRAARLVRSLSGVWVDFSE